MVVSDGLDCKLAGLTGDMLVIDRAVVSGHDRSYHRIGSRVVVAHQIDRLAGKRRGESSRCRIVDGRKSSDPGVGVNQSPFVSDSVVESLVRHSPGSGGRGRHKR